jgi:hypothetical protein
MSQKGKHYEDAKYRYERTDESARHISESFGYAYNWCTKLAKRDGWVKYGANETAEPEPFSAKTFVEKRKSEASLRQLKTDNENWAKEYELLLQAHEIALDLKNYTPVNVPNISFDRGVKNQAIPLVQYSDWHVEEKVEKSTTRGLNEFNPDIARKRVKALTANTLKLIRKERQDSVIRKMFMNLGGDFINSYLHEHDVQMNYMSPPEALIFAKELLKESIMTILEYGDLKQLDILCTRGNHPRLTKKMQSSNDYKMNLEAMLYQMLRQEIKDSLVNWHIPESEIGMANVGGKVIRALHGHQIKFQGGVGGISIPLVKYIMRLDQTEKADYTQSSHWHQWQMIGACNTSINGSLVGFNAYALGCGFKFEKPIQGLQMLDEKWGFTGRFPIFCE